MITSNKIFVDLIESRFFSYIDDKGAKSMLKLVQHGVESLDSAVRSDFTRLLLSLNARNPEFVSYLKNEYKAKIESAFNNDPDIQKELTKNGIDQTASDHYEKLTGVSISHSCLLRVQGFVENPAYIERINNFTWKLYEINKIDGSFLLADMPLIRENSIESLGCLLCLPLSPQHVFVAAASGNNIASFDRVTSLQIRKRTNESSVSLADTYVFAIDKSNSSLIRSVFRQRFGKNAI